MEKFVNVPDLLLIGVSAYVLVSVLNGFLRYLSVPQLQA